MSPQHTFTPRATQHAFNYKGSELHFHGLSHLEDAYIPVLSQEPQVQRFFAPLRRSEPNRITRKPHTIPKVSVAGLNHTKSRKTHLSTLGKSQEVEPMSLDPDPNLPDLESLGLGWSLNQCRNSGIASEEHEISEEPSQEVKALTAKLTNIF